MHRRIHFISGLPRSGSMLLSALLAHKLRFQAGVSSLFAGVFSTLRGQPNGRNELSVFINERSVLARSATRSAQRAHRLAPNHNAARQ